MTAKTIANKDGLYYGHDGALHLHPVVILYGWTDRQIRQAYRLPGMKIINMEISTDETRFAV